MDKQSKIISGIGVVLILVIIVFAIVSNSGNKNNIRENYYEGEVTLQGLSDISSCPLTEDKDAFAKCLTEKGMTMYGAEWCAHCKSQKALFGDSFKYVKYVECPENTDLCIAKGIQNFPTWIKE